MATLRLRSVFGPLERTPTLSKDAELSVMIPLKGKDRTTKANLRTVLEAKAPEKSEYLFVMETSADPAYALCQELKAAYPDKAIIILLSGPAGRRMGKQHNLAAALKRSRYRVVASVDADVYLRPDAFAVALEQLSPAEVGTVFALPYYAGPGLAGGHLVALYTNYYIMPFVGALASTGRADFIIGAFWLSSKTALEAAGGLDRLTAFVNDDSVLGKAIKEAGFNNKMLAVPVTLALEPKHLPGGFRHLQKWVAMLRAEGLGIYLSIALFWHPVLFAVLALLAGWLANAPLILGFSLLGFALFIRTASLLMLNGHVYAALSRARFLSGLLPYELLVVPMLFGWGFFKRDLIWRGTRYKLGHGGKIISAEKLS